MHTKKLIIFIFQDKAFPKNFISVLKRKQPIQTFTSSLLSFTIEKARKRYFTIPLKNNNLTS